MKLILGVHIAYIFLIGIIIIRHVLIPMKNTRTLEMEMESLKTRYNQEVRKMEQSEKVIRKLRDLVVYSDIIGCSTVNNLFADGSLKNNEVEYLYAKLKEEINKPRKVFLRYSIECNLGLVCSLVLPSLLVVFTNLKGLIKKYGLRHCFTRHIYEEPLKKRV